MLKFFPLIVLLMAACHTSSERLSRALNERALAEYADTQIIPVLVATNRATGRSPGCSDDYFGVTGQKDLTYVSCGVSVPKNHPVGALDESDERSPDPHLYFRVTAFEPLNERVLLERAAAADEVIVFVHGFNVPFSEALNRAAQIKYDLKFPGQVILFSWPAGADEGILSRLDLPATYRANRLMADLTRQNFSAFMDRLSDTRARIHVVVHSMGHEVAIPGLLNARARLDQLVLNAPDFSVDEFRKVAPVLTRMARRVTLYCSPGDNALIASEKINSSRRIGRCAKIPGVDVINVNEVDSPALGIGGLGHGYYSGRAILTDLYQVLLGVDVRRRLFVRLSSEYGGEDYVLRK